MTAGFFAAVESAETARVRELLASDTAPVRARDDARHASESGNQEIARLLRERAARGRGDDGSLV